jgi:biotin carboxyl carrier protein
MSKTYKIKVNDSYEMDLDAGIAIDYLKKGNKRYHIIENNQSYNVQIVTTDFKDKSYQIKVNGNLYKVAINDELDQLIKDLGLTVGNKQKDSNVKAPMPGLILDIQVSDGQEVKEGDALLVLEAMKMENLLVAPKDGIIKSIKVTKGEAVDKKQLLIEME